MYKSQTFDIVNPANGDVYDGEYFEGKHQGKGIYYYANGNRYEGASEHHLLHTA